MSTCKVKHGAWCENVVAPHSALVAPDHAPDPLLTGASDTVSSQNHQEIVAAAVPAAAAAASRAEEEWMPAPPPLPRGLREQFEKAHASLVEMDQKLKLYSERVAALEHENSQLKQLLKQLLLKNNAASEDVAVDLPTPWPPPPQRPHQEVSFPHPHGRLPRLHQPIAASVV